MRATALKKYNKILTQERWYTKDYKDAQIISLVLVAEKISHDYKKSSDKSNTSNRENTKGEPAYIRDIPPWMLEEPKGGVGNKKGRKIILVVQGKPRWQMPVGLPQARRPR